VIGIAAALANWGVARLLWKPSQNNAAIRLAYIHNIGDVWVSLAPVLAGALLILTGYPVFDPLMAGAIGFHPRFVPAVDRPLRRLGAVVVLQRLALQTIARGSPGRYPVDCSPGMSSPQSCGFG
jgi:Cation efflux family